MLQCFEGERSGDLVQVIGIMRKENYHSILQIHNYWTKFILQEDDDPKHSPKLCQNYIHSKENQKGLRIMTWSEGVTLTKPKSEPEMTSKCFYVDKFF
ncbi:hypothetical protein LDENG_00035120, partial [Lucifuga dentata]